MKKVLTGLATGVFVFCIVGVANALPVSDSDLWQGAIIGNHSPELESSNGSSVFGFFDGNEGYYGTEAGNAIFVGAAADSTQSIEWSTGSAVTIQSINFVTYHDFDGGDIRNRGIASFSLSYLDGSDWISFYDWAYTNFAGDLHYGGGPSYQFNPDVYDMNRSYLELTANLNAAVTAQAFKANFVQYGPSGSGLRVVELDAYDTPQPVPEPTTMLLFGTGLAGLAGISLRRKKK